jgi:hypothetical protein
MLLPRTSQIGVDFSDLASIGVGCKMTVERSRPRLRALFFRSPDDPITAITRSHGYPSPHPSTRIPKGLDGLIPSHSRLA